LDCAKNGASVTSNHLILSSVTHPQVVANLYEFLSSAEHKERYFEERLEPNSCLAPLTSIVNTMEVNGAKDPIVLQNIFFCVHKRKETHTDK